MQINLSNFSKKKYLVIGGGMLFVAVLAAVAFFFFGSGGTLLPGGWGVQKNASTTTGITHVVLNESAYDVALARARTWQPDAVPMKVAMVNATSNAWSFTFVSPKKKGKGIEVDVVGQEVTATNEIPIIGGGTPLLTNAASGGATGSGSSGATGGGVGVAAGGNSGTVGSSSGGGSAGAGQVAGEGGGVLPPFPVDMISADEAIAKAHLVKGYESAVVVSVEMVFNSIAREWYWGVKMNNGVTITVRAAR